MEYSPAEYCDMLLMYGEFGRNARLAAREYNIRYPERRAISRNVFLRLVHRVRETGSVISDRRRNAVIERHIRTVQNEEAIIQAVVNEPSTSIRKISRELHISSATVQRVLKENRHHAYHFTKVQNLLPQDHERRVRFCTWLLEREEIQPGFVHTILFSDESCFTREGVFNTHNSHIWANENPNVYKVRNYQHRFNINLWAGILNDTIIGPFEMPVRLNGNIYTNFLRNDFINLIENIPLNQRQQMFFQHDGAPPHISLNARRVLDANFPERWIGRGGPISWPARSPDLTPLDYFLWGTLKEYVYQEHINDRGELEGKIIEAVATITPQMIRNAGRNLLRRAQLCIQCDGGHFEHLL